MKVLYFISYPYEATGSQRSLFATVKYLPNVIEAHLLLSDEGYVQEMFETIPVATTIIRPTGALQVYGKAAFAWSFFQKINIVLFHYLPFQWKVYRYIRKGKFDIVHCNSHRSAVLVLLATKLSRAKLITHLRNEVRFSNIYTRLYERYSDAIITVSKSIRQDVAPQYQPKVHTVYNGLARPDVKQTIPANKNKLQLICMSLIVPHKGLHHLIDAAVQLKQAGFGEQFHITCLGPFLAHHAAYKAWLMQKIADAELDNMEFLGYKKDPFPYLRNSDVVILPSVREETLEFGGETHQVIGNEGLPRVLLEACGFGKPAIAFDVPGAREIISEGYNGFVIETGNASALAHAIQRYIEQADLLAEMGANAQRVYEEKFAVEQNVKGIEAVYRSVLEQDK